MRPTLNENIMQILNNSNLLSNICMLKQIHMGVTIYLLQEAQICYSKHLGRRGASDGPCTRRNSPFTEMHALSSCHGWQGKCQGLFFLLVLLLATEKQYNGSHVMVFPYKPFYCRKNDIHGFFSEENVRVHHFAGTASTVGTVVLPFYNVVWIKADAQTINCPIQTHVVSRTNEACGAEACPQDSLYADTLLQTLS